MEARAYSDVRSERKGGLSRSRKIPARPSILSR